MRNSRLLYLLICFVFFSACGYLPPKWSKTVTGGKQAISKAYHLSKQKFIYDKAIDTNAVYIAENDFVVSNAQGNKIREKEIYYDFFRFSEKGLAFISNHTTTKFTNSDFNAMQGGQYCFYSVKDSILKLERYNFDTNVFEYWYGKIQENGDIYFYNSRGRPFGTYTQPLKYIYRKTPANLSTKIIFPE
jgi:hypothetical protein